MLAVLTVAHIVLAWRRLRGYLRYFQQEGYDARRFARWLQGRSFTDPAFWLALTAAVLWWDLPQTALWGCAAGALLLAWRQPDPTRTGKIRLALTWRARRILAVAMVLAVAAWFGALAAMASAGEQAPLVAAAVVWPFLPLVLVVGNLALAPYEHHVQASYQREAEAHLASVAPTVIGITGSYGKSSSKAMLAHMLQFQSPTLAASGSINTPMGITRHIREDLVAGHANLVVEMGAFGIGSIARLCALTPPACALITAVGDMHLERFGSLENVVRAKSELAEALPDGALLVVNADSPGARRIAEAHAGRLDVRLYGERADGPLTTRVTDVRWTPAGSTCVLLHQGVAYPCETPLFGRPMLQNLAGAFTLAVALGMDPLVALAACRTLRPVRNRLEVVTDAGVTWIRDAYNSNQFGFRAALEVAAGLPGRRRVLVTPGVIELGEMQASVNQALAREAAATCDVMLVVAETNRHAFVEGCAEAGASERLRAVATRTEAFAWLRAHLAEGDIVLLENDLPDLYESSTGLFWPDRAREGRA